MGLLAEAGFWLLDAFGGFWRHTVDVTSTQNISVKRFTSRRVKYRLLPYIIYNNHLVPRYNNYHHCPTTLQLPSCLIKSIVSRAKAEKILLKMI